MKFYCEYTNKLYDSEKECKEAEAVYLEEKNRKANAEENARKNLDNLYETYSIKNANVKKENAELNAAIRDLSKALDEYRHNYNYVPEKYRSIQLLSWLL